MRTVAHRVRQIWPPPFMGETRFKLDDADDAYDGGGGGIRAANGRDIQLPNGAHIHGRLYVKNEMKKGLKKKGMKKNGIKKMDRRSLSCLPSDLRHNLKMDLPEHFLHGIGVLAVKSKNR